MMTGTSDPYKVNSLILTPEVDPVHGRVVWDAPRSLWNGFMLLGALILGPLYFSWDAFVVPVIRLAFIADWYIAVSAVQNGWNIFSSGWERQSAWVDRYGPSAPMTCATGRSASLPAMISSPTGMA
jgi:hypothetical protein